MQSSKTRIRKDFAPLTVAVSIRCTTPASPLTQVFNGDNSEYEPDRELTPTTILPVVVASCDDGSWKEPHSNSQLANMKWYVNGVDISTLSDWSGKYEIDQNGSTRGAITISKNISPGEQVELHFEAELSDTRLGMLIPIVTDTVVLRTSEKAGETYSLSLKDGANIQYDITKDKLALYDYKVAHGLVKASAAAQAAATDNNSYLHTVNFEVRKGKDIITSGYTVKLYYVKSVSSQTAITTSDERITEITNTSVTFDLRLMTKETFYIAILVDGVEVARQQIGISRVWQNYNITPTNGTDIHPSDTQRYDEVMADCDGNTIECPGMIFQILWLTDSASNHGVKHNEGSTTLIELSKTGIGNTESDSWMDVYCTSEYKPAHEIATDASGVQWTDASGEPYIFN